MVAEKKASKKKTATKKPTASKKAVEAKIVKPKRKTPGFLKPFASIGRYFKGSWNELKQVRWPDRRATWVLTIAVLIFTGFFTLMIVALDAGFEYILNRILL